MYELAPLFYSRLFSVFWVAFLWNVELQVFTYFASLQWYYFVLRLNIFHCLQVFLGQSGGLDTEGNELPRLVYVSREKRPGFQHHKKAGAMNALVRN